MVEIEQVDTDLAADIRVKPLDTIDPTRFAGFSPDIPDEKCIFLQEQFINYGFGESVQFVNENTFCVNLLTELPVKASDGLYNQQAWMIFGVHNVKPIKRGVKCEMYQNVIVSLQNYLFELQSGCNEGFIQLYSLPEIVRLDGQLYQQHSLLQLSVYRNAKARNITPGTIVVKPREEDRLYVPLLPKQRLQVITPSHAEIDVNPPLMFLNVEDRTMCNGSRVKSTSIQCTKMLTRGEIITVTTGKKQSAIWIPGIITTSDGDLYPFFNKPDCKTHLITHNMAGFAITDDADPNWLLDDFAEIRQGDAGTIVTFTKPQKAVSIEQTDGYWWLSTSQAHALDTVT